MKPKNLEDFRKLSNIVENGSDLLVQSSKMNFEKNEYKNEIWKYSKNIWKKNKWSEKKINLPRKLFWGLKKHILSSLVGWHLWECGLLGLKIEILGD